MLYSEVTSALKDLLTKLAVVSKGKKAVSNKGLNAYHSSACVSEDVGSKHIDT